MPSRSRTNRPPILVEPREPTNGSSDRGLLKERAYVEIKRLILSGAVAAGSFLAERQLAAQLGMSKTPIRAALERLELEGFVTVSPQQGIIVRDLTVHDIADLYEIRTALESFVLRSMAGRLIPPQIERIQANLRSQEANCQARDVQRGVELDAAFHLMFGEFLGNHEVLRVMAYLRDKIHRLISRVFTLNRDRIVTSYHEHCGIAEAVIQGDAALAVRRIEEHLEYGKQYLLSPRRT